MKEFENIGSILKAIVQKSMYNVIGLSNAIDLERALELARDPKTGYRRFIMEKKSGGKRPIDAPHDDLKFVQRMIYKKILLKDFTPSKICHSTLERSIVSNAYAHLGVPADVVPNPSYITIPWREPQSIHLIDLQGAFPSIKTGRIKEIYQDILHDENAAEILTELSQLRGSLPQGAPPSPLLFNLACRELDRDLEEEFADPRLPLTRYVDDISVTSLDSRVPQKKQKMLRMIVEKHGFKIKEEKVANWDVRDKPLNVTGIALNPAKRAIFLPYKTREIFRLLMFKSYKTLCEANSEWFEQERDISLMKFITQGRRRYKRAFGTICGVASLAFMVYGKDEAPKRTFSWFEGYDGDVSSATFQAILDDIRNGDLVGEIWGYNQF